MPLTLKSEADCQLQRMQEETSQQPVEVQCAVCVRECDSWWESKVMEAAQDANEDKGRCTKSHL